MENKPFNNIITGFFFHLLGGVIQTLTGVEILQALTCTIGWYFLLKGSIRFAHIGFRMPFKGIYKAIFIFYLFICFIMIIRGYLIDYNYQWISLQGLINYHLFFPYYILPYFVPLIIFVPYKYYDFRLFIKYSIIISITCIITFIIYYQDIIRSSTLQALGLGGEYGFGATFAEMYIPVAFAVLCKKYIYTKYWLINSIGLLTSLITFAIAARRGSSAIVTCLFIFNLYFWIKSMKFKNKIRVIAISTIIIVGLSYIFLTSDSFTYIHQRGLEDTRSEVDKALLSQMNETELFFGKGLNGRYYFPLMEDDFLNGWRYGSETGFYNIVLKGGYLMAFTYILLLIYPALVGIFKSKNILCKALGFYIILSLIELYPFGWLAFNIKYLIIWIGVVLCYNKKIRALNDKQIYIHFFRQRI